MAAPTREAGRWEEPCCRRWGLRGGSESVRAGAGGPPPGRCPPGTAQGRAGRSPDLAGRP